MRHAQKTKEKQRSTCVNFSIGDDIRATTIHSFIQPIFIEYILCAKQSSRSLGLISKRKKKKIPALMEFYWGWRGDIQ